MQTFLPYPDYEQSAHVLDRQRLGKQRVEVLQILNILHEIQGAKMGWVNHPAVKMWRGYEPQLCAYGIAVCEEWLARRYNDTCLDKIKQHLEWAISAPFDYPPWFGNEAFHLSHQSNLLRKDPDHYRKYFGDKVPLDLPYVWPVK